MSRVTLEEYARAKSAVKIGAEEMDIISRAADYGFIDPSEMNLEEDDSIAFQQGAIPVVGEDVRPIDKIIEEERDMSLEEIRALKKANEELAKQLEDERTLREEIGKITPATVNPGNDFVEALEKLSIDDFDSEYDYMKEQARLHSEIIKSLSQGGTDPRIEKAIKYAEEADVQRQQIENERIRTRKEAELKNAMTSFWDRHPEVKPTRGYEEVSEDLARFKKEIADSLQLDDKGVNRTIARLADPATAETVRKSLETSGVKIMDDFDAVNETIRVFNYMDGYKLNPATGEYVPVRTLNGEVQKLADLETAYFVMNKQRLLADQRREDILKLTEKRGNIENRSQGIPVERLAPIGAEEALSPAVMSQIFADARANPRKYTTDPEAKARLEAAYRKAGV